MEPKFQTSFIPKKSASVIGGLSTQKTVRRGTSAFMVIAVIAFLGSLGAAGGAYFWKNYLIGQQQQFKIDLKNRENEFKPELIQQLKEASVQIDTARQILNSHIALSQIFAIIQQFTVTSVRFLTLTVTGPTSQNNNVDITMTGYGTNLAALAFQSDVLGALDQYGLSNVFKNPIISDPALDVAGKVAFGFKATLNPSKLSYENLVNPQTSGAAPVLNNSSSTSP